MADAREDLLELYRSASSATPPRIRGLPMSMTRVFEDPLKTEARWGRRPGQRQAGGGFGGESVEWLP
jgi:hypothetical protein